MLNKILTTIMGAVKSIYTLAVTLLLIAIFFAGAFFILSVFMPSQVETALEIVRRLIWQ